MRKKHYYNNDNKAESLSDKSNRSRGNRKMALAEVVRTRRKERGLTQEELAILAGISVGTVRDIEQGRHTNITIIPSHKLTRRLKLDKCLCELVGEGDC